MPGRTPTARPTLTVDVAIALAVTAVQLSVALRPAGDGTRELADLAHLGTLCLVGGGLVLLVRRRWPVAVFALTVVASTLYYALDFPEGPAMVACWVAAYTLAAHGDGRRSLAIAGLGIGAMAVAWLTMGHDTATHENLGWFFYRVVSPALFAALGESVRGRRVITAEALRRAEQAEQTREEEARARVDAERLRIAREVHDTVAHAIAVINVQSGVTAHLLDRQPERARETLEVIESTSSRVLREMRTILDVLRDADDGRAPHPGLGQLAALADTARDAGLDVDVRLSLPEDGLPSAVDGAGYRIIQESLTNVIRHVGATRVRVAVGHDADRLTIRVANERGETAGGTAADAIMPGSGVLGMRERCELLGGHLAAGPRPGGGFEVCAQLPLAPVAAVL